MIYGILILLLVTVVTVALFLTILRPRKQTSAPPPVRTVGPPKPTPLLASGSFKVAYGFYAKGSYAAAAEAYRQALEGSPDAFDAPDARYRLVESLRAQGKRSAADVEESILVAQLATLPETASTARVRGWLARM